MRIEDYIEELERGLLELSPTWRRCANCERVFRDCDMMSDEYCDRCWHYVEACEAERIACLQDQYAELEIEQSIDRRHSNGN